MKVRMKVLLSSTMLLASCAEPVTASVTSADVVASDVGADVETEPRLTEPWSLDFATVTSLDGWAMADCGGRRRPNWRVKNGVLLGLEECRQTVPGVAGIELGTTLHPSTPSFAGGWIVLEVKVDSDGLFGVQYGGHQSAYYRASIYNEELRARIAAVGLPPFLPDGRVGTGEEALLPSYDVLGETLYVFSPLNLWFELAVEWDGRRHALYVDRKLLVEAELPSDVPILPGGPIAIYSRAQASLQVRRMTTYLPGPPPWERDEEGGR